MKLRIDGSFQKVYFSPLKGKDTESTQHLRQKTIKTHKDELEMEEEEPGMMEEEDLQGATGTTRKHKVTRKTTKLPPSQIVTRFQYRSKDGTDTKPKGR